MKFTKMHGLGNDYIYVYGEVPENIKEMSIKLSDRHFGIGSDGMIYISHSDTADFKMRIFNADGSEAKMCGNGIRCVGKYVYDKGYTAKKELKIETLSGIKTLSLHESGGEIKTVSVGMGKAAVSEDIRVEACGQGIVCTPVTVGNPHAVVFTKDINGADIYGLGPVMEKIGIFPDGANIEFVQVLGKGKLRMRVWERGSGVTMACGTGACASAAAAVHHGFCSFDENISVILDGGTLNIKISPDYSVLMEGPAETAFEGEVAKW